MENKMTNPEGEINKPKTEQPDPIMQFFGYSYLPEHLQQFSKPFSDMADWIVVILPRNPECTVALRKLLEAKDCAVRARIYK